MRSKILPHISSPTQNPCSGTMCSSQTWESRGTGPCSERGYLCGQRDLNITTLMTLVFVYELRSSEMPQSKKTKGCWCPAKAMLLLLQSHLSTRILPSSLLLPSFLLPLDYISDGCRELKGVDGKITSFSSFKRYCSQFRGRQNKRKHTSQKNKKTASCYGLPLSARCPVKKVYKAKQLFGHCSLASLPSRPSYHKFLCL